MTKILIVEDQVLIANHIKNILLDNGYKNIDCAYKINNATQLLKHFDPDVILLDINVEGKDTGIHWAKEYVTKSKIIFITGQTELQTLKHALTLNPISYLTKPVKKIDLLAVLALAVKDVKPKYILIKDSYKDVKILFEDLLFVKSDNNYIDIQTTSKKYTVRNTLDDFLELLDKDLFKRVHRSYIINTEKIHQKSTGFVEIDTFKIPISRNINLNI
jgi:two-component system response regulator LytT